MKKGTKIILLAVILLITLLLHILFLYFFTTVQFPSRDLLTQFLSHSESQEHPLQSHAPAHSAPVVFHDAPEEEKPQPPPAIPEPPKTLVAHSAHPTRQDPTKQEEQTPKSILQEPKPDAKEEPKPVLKPQEDEELYDPVEKKEEPALQQVEPTMLKDLEPRKKIEKDIQKEVPKKQKPSSTKKTRTTKGLSLADLGKQYMQKVSAASIDTGGYGSLRVEGEGYGHPSAYQIAVERYVAKMCREIETTYRIHTNHAIQATQHKPFCLVVELNSNGTVNTIYPSVSSGVARIDEFAMSIFKSASTSFPKLPDAMGTAFRIQFGINHVDHMAYLSKGGTLSMH